MISKEEEEEEVQWIGVERVREMKYKDVVRGKC